MTNEEKTATVAGMPGGWTLTRDKMLDWRPRYVASRPVDDGTQYESAVMFEDLLERIRLRNLIPPRRATEPEKEAQDV